MVNVGGGIIIKNYLLLYILGGGVAIKQLNTLSLLLFVIIRESGWMNNRGGRGPVLECIT
jgi:hypothetical protein